MMVYILMYYIWVAIFLFIFNLLIQNIKFLKSHSKLLWIVGTILSFPILFAGGHGGGAMVPLVVGFFFPEGFYIKFNSIIFVWAIPLILIYLYKLNMNSSK